MKIKPDHYTKIRDAIARVPKETRALQRQRAESDPRVKDIAKRIRWDLLWLTGLTPWLCKEVYAYADDSHIDTALRAIVKELGVG